MKNLLGSIIFLLVILAIQGCSAPYYDHSKKDWDNLSEEERIAIKAEYQLIVDTKRDQPHKDKIEARTQSVIDRGVEGAKYGK